MSGPSVSVLAQMFETFFAEDSCGSFLVDVDGRLLACNAAAARVWNIDVARDLGCPFADLELSYRVPGLRAAVADVMGGGAAVQLGERVIQNRQSAAVSVRVSGVVVAGAVAGVLVQATNVAVEARLSLELRLTAEELESTRSDLQTANDTLALSGEELETTNTQLGDANDQLVQQLDDLETAHLAEVHKNDFLAMLAHELRTPLAPILTAAHILRRTGTRDPVAQRAGEVIERQARHQARLLDDLLDVVRITRGKLQLRRAVVSLGASVSEAVDGVRGHAEAKRQHLTFTPPPIPVFVDADATRLAQIVTNIVHNAVKYTPPGGEVRVTAAREDGAAVVRVRDSGIGIAADVLPRIFEPFVQGDPTRSQSGLGIGLAVVRSLVEMHGGTVEAHSDGLRRGSEFVIRLPAAAAPATAATIGAQPRLRPRRVLIIDDSADTREMLRTALQLDGHHVEDAADGGRGVELALARRPDVVLIDINLPDVDGYAIARRLRAALGAGVLLVAVTGHGQAEDRRHSRDAGFDVHLVKPVVPEVLNRVLARRLRGEVA